MDNPISMAELDAVLHTTHGTGSTRAVPPLNPSINVDECLTIASETNERGTLHVLYARHERDDTTPAIV
jgi:hypothetical protein